MIVGGEGIGEREFADSGDHRGVDIVCDKRTGKGDCSCKLLGCCFKRVESFYIEEEVDI